MNLFRPSALGEMSFRLIKSSWKPAEIERLRELAAAGATPFRIAAALNRSILSVRSRARLLGIDIRTITEFRKTIRAAERDAGVRS